MSTYLFLHSSQVSRMPHLLVVGEALGINPLVGQALVVRMVMHKNHLQTVVVEAEESLHLTLRKPIVNKLDKHPSQFKFYNKYVRGIGQKLREVNRRLVTLHHRETILFCEPGFFLALQKKSRH